MEQVKGTPEVQDRIITSYRETRSDPDLAAQLLSVQTGMTSTCTLYENYMDGFHTTNLESGIHMQTTFWELVTLLKGAFKLSKTLTDSSEILKDSWA